MGNTRRNFIKSTIGVGAIAAVSGSLSAAEGRAVTTAADMSITVHMSGGGVGYVDMLHFASCVPHIGEFQEYKGGVDRTGRWYEPPLKLTGGAVTVPTGPGFGLASDLKMFKNAKPVGRR